jgi:hypothetical protein
MSIWILIVILGIYAFYALTTRLDSKKGAHPDIPDYAFEVFGEMGSLSVKTIYNPSNH